MAKCIFENLTEMQARVLAKWFECQGEQDCIPWCDDREVTRFFTDVERGGGYSEITPDGDVIVYCKSING